MRGLKSTIALVVVLAGLGAYIYFVTSKMPAGGSSADADAKKQEQVFASLQADKRGRSRSRPSCRHPSRMWRS